MIFSLSQLEKELAQLERLSLSLLPSVEYRLDNFRIETKTENLKIETNKLLETSPLLFLFLMFLSLEAKMKQ